MSDLLSAVTNQKPDNKGAGKGPEPRKYNPSKYSEGYANINWGKKSKVLVCDEKDGPEADKAIQMLDLPKPDTSIIDFINETKSKL